MRDPGPDGNAAPGTWNQKALGLLGIVGGVVVIAGFGVYTFLNSAARLHPIAADVPSVRGAPPPPKWAAAVERGREIARENLAGRNLPGLSVAVGIGGALVWAEGFGWANLESRLPVTPATRFRIGHVSKALTSAGVGLLLERGLLHLDDEIQTSVPEFPRKQWPITLRQLMAHVAGVKHYDSERDYMPSGHCTRAAEGLKAFAEEPLRFEPDTQYRYSTFGWVLVSAAVEAAAKEPFFAFMRAHVFTPLGMSDTVPDSPAEPMPDRAEFYYPRYSGDPYYGTELASAVDYSCFAGAGGLLSTPTDLVRFGLALGGETLLKSGTVTKLQTRQQLTSGEETEYGLGWMLESFPLAGEPARSAGHSSRTLLGGATSFMIFPDRGLVIAVTSNISFANTRVIALNIAKAFAEQGRTLERK